jgi:hypothetical protein
MPKKKIMLKKKGNAPVRKKSGGKGSSALKGFVRNTNPQEGSSTVGPSVSASFNNGKDVDTFDDNDIEI